MAEISRDVVIVGADTAGLAAANALRMAGLSVMVLEAADRVDDAAGDLPQLLAERLGEDVRLGHPVHRIRWSPAPSITASAPDITVRARFAILTESGSDDVAFEPSHPRSASHAPIHVVESDDAALAAATTIVAIIRS